METHASPRGSHSQYADDILPGSKGKQISFFISARDIFLGIGSFLICLLVIIPMWNCIALLRDTVYRWIAGAAIPIALFIILVATLFLYVFVVILFWKYAREEVKTEQTMMMIGGAHITVIGLLLMIFAHQIQQQAQLASDEFFGNCEFGPKSRRLFEVSQALHELRATASCQAQPSVEFCPGFREQYSNDRAVSTLKAMEGELMCSGFCYRQVLTGGTSPATANATEGAPQDPWVLPPTLFSQGNFQASCDGAAARRVQFFVQDIGVQTFFEGGMMVMVSVLIGFLVLIGFCRRLPKETGGGSKKNPTGVGPAGGDYGAVVNGAAVKRRLS